MSQFDNINFLYYRTNSVGSETSNDLLTAKLKSENTPDSIYKVIEYDSINDLLSDGDNSTINMSFDINGCSSALINSIRRVLLSDIPVVSFSDKWHENPLKRSINIIDNTSAVHNEFVSHRVSLCPIKMLDNIKIKSLYSKENRERIYNFSEKPPLFMIDCNNTENITKLVTTNDIKIKNNSDKKDKRIFFEKDIFTDEYILINKLKKDEKLKIDCDLTIGFGHENASYCPVGTVSYSFNERVLNEEQHEKLFQLAAETNKTLTKESFDILNMQRIYKTDEYGKANSINLKIESLGIFPPEVLFIDSLGILKLKILDIVYDCESLIKNIKPSFEDLQGFELILKNQNHTIGNLLNDYLKNYITGQFKSVPDHYDNAIREIMLYSSYIMPHPLKEEVLFKIRLHKNKLPKTDEKITETYFKNIEPQEEDLSIFDEPLQKILEPIYKIDDIEKKFTLLIVIDTLLKIYFDIDDLEIDFLKYIDIDVPRSFSSELDMVNDD